MKDVTKENLEVSGPVKDERQKLDAISKTLGIDSKSKSDEELRGIITVSYTHLTLPTNYSV